MKTLKFEYDGRPFRVYLDRDGSVFVDVKDGLAIRGRESEVEKYLKDYPAHKICNGRPAWKERFFYAMMDNLSMEKFIWFYLNTVQPAIRSSIMSGKMNGAYVMDFKVRVTGQDGKETAVRPYLFPVMDLSGNIKGFDAFLKRHRLPDMNPRQKIYYRGMCKELAKKLSVLFPDNGDYFCRPVRSLPTLEELHNALCKIGG